ncbi:MAG: hypothetical protein N4A31_05495 [Rickettsiales bacterium]|nr:hypothetical protein [Rickettsiales bacterium]
MITYKGLKFILENNNILGIAFTNTGEAFHFNGPDTKIVGLTLTIIGLSLEKAMEYYNEITSIHDIESLKLNELSGAGYEYYQDSDPIF